jgi:hypothetical protein
MAVNSIRGMVFSMWSETFSRNATRELLGKVSVRSVPRLLKETIVRCEWVRQLATSQSARELKWDRRQPARTWSCEYGSWGIYGIGSRYQTTTGEDTVDWEDLVRAVGNCGVCELTMELQLRVVTVRNCWINPVTNSNPVYSHSTKMWQYSTCMQAIGHKETEKTILD